MCEVHQNIYPRYSQGLNESFRFKHPVDEIPQNGNKMFERPNHSQFVHINPTCQGKSVKIQKNHFHLHLISDSTGETIQSVSRAVTAQYTSANAVEHVSPFISSETQLEKVLSRVDSEPGIVLFTMANESLANKIETTCSELGIPAVNLLRPVIEVFQSYLGQQSSGRAGAQHTLDKPYFKRMDALNFTMAHDDGQLCDDIEEADIILIGISRTSKTPTAICLAQHGIKTINIPLYLESELPDVVLNAKSPLIVALVATPDRITQLRKNRVLSFDSEIADDTYVDRATIAEEIANSRKLCKNNNWPMIDVSKKSIEETAAEILTLYNDMKTIQQAPENP